MTNSSSKETFEGYSQWGHITFYRSMYVQFKIEVVNVLTFSGYLKAVVLRPGTYLPVYT